MVVPTNETRTYARKGDSAEGSCFGLGCREVEIVKSIIVSNKHLANGM